jgi:putative phosphoribosyl transferase
MQRPFQDRRHAGRLLAKHFGAYAGRSDVSVLALPRGGVPVAFEVSRALQVPLDVFLVRKLGVPGHRELAMGAIAAGGIRLINSQLVQALGISREQVEAVIEKEERELARRAQLYRGNMAQGSMAQPTLAGRVVILIDDGLATGSSMRVAIEALRQQAPAKIVVGVPIAPASTCRELTAEADEVICAVTPAPFHSVGLWYEDFSQTEDEEVRKLLDRAAREQAGREYSVASAESGLEDRPHGAPGMR